jgi:ESF2/ABP1 family protein
MGSEDDNEVEEQQECAAKRSHHKTGVVYLPHVPRYMGPGEAKTYFQNFGLPVARSFFRPESRARREARGKRGGDMLRKKYTEAWIEFARKSHAKMAVATFNSQRVGGRASYQNEMWNLRYLSGFKFDDLMEEEVYVKAMHEKKLKAQIEAAKKDTQSFLETVSQAKKVSYAKQKRRERGEQVEDHQRSVPQKKTRGGGGGGDDVGEAEGLSNAVLEQIMGKSK